MYSTQGLPYIERLAAEKKVKSGELLKTTVGTYVVATIQCGMVNFRKQRYVNISDCRFHCLTLYALLCLSPALTLALSSALPLFLHYSPPLSLPPSRWTHSPYLPRGGHIKVWEMVKRSQSYLGQGYVSQTWLDQHFLYSYYVWVNIPAAANRLSEPARFCSPTVKITDTCVPGVIGTHFYRYVHHYIMLRHALS